MRPILHVFALGMLFCNSALANCDISTYRWECDMPVRDKPQQHSRSMVTCGSTNLYVTQKQFLKLMRYQRANINMVLKVNGEFIDAPCTARDFF